MSEQIEIIIQTPEQMEAARVELAQLDSILMGDRAAQLQSLEAEFDYLNSDESVDETIRANEYEFTETGERA